MRITHVSPTYFDPSSVIGGGERYACELARAMSHRARTTLITFGQDRHSGRDGALEWEVFPAPVKLSGNPFNPLSVGFLPALAAADIIHVHQVHSLVSDLACLAGVLCRKAVFLTDHGGGGSRVLNGRLPVFRGYAGAVAQSVYALRMLPSQLRDRTDVIPGGVDVEKFSPAPDGTPPAKQFLFVGRFFPHKGIDVLIEGFRQFHATAAGSGYRLRLLGSVGDRSAYFHHLRSLAAGIPVDLISGADDRQLVAEYRAAAATLLPSVHRPSCGSPSEHPELMGLVLLESQACGTPVIATGAGGSAEFFQDGRTGIAVPENDPGAIAGALGEVAGWGNGRRRSVGAAARELVLSLSWETVAARHLEVYAMRHPRAARGGSQEGR